MTAPDNSEGESIDFLPAFTAVDGAGDDFVLQTLINLVNSIDGVEIKITLQVSGMLVSGLLTGGKQYFKEFGRLFSAEYTDPASQSSIEEGFASLGEIFNDHLEGTEERPPSQFVHLKDAQFFQVSGPPIPSESGVLWRGKISSVGGYFLGTLIASQN